ncbi:hypothetical protein AB0H76_33740 [Nocardia sp. NPDC050712]|uniref:hypothetical protein n=1 Tax=Nocardia sp. NPDC050712 TaxID=3155518 RepID=UPI0033C30A09
MSGGEMAAYHSGEPIAGATGAAAGAGATGSGSGSAMICPAVSNHSCDTGIGAADSATCPDSDATAASGSPANQLRGAEVAVVSTPMTRLAKLGGPSPTLHHSAIRPSVAASITMP